MYVPVYDNSELILKDKIEELHKQWIANIINKDNSDIADELRDLYVPDGFYPYYTKQKKKILFIGKEGLELSGNDYISCLYDAYKNKIVGNKPLNQYRFHTTMLYISYAIEREVYNWSQLPFAEEFIDEFGEPDGFSFAFMNLSKFSNESGRWQADEELIDSFIRLSQNDEINFIQKEIELLNPDLIIGMNLGDKMRHLGTFDNFQFFGPKKDVCFQTLTTTYGKYNYIDTWHFAAPNKSPELQIFNPLIGCLLNKGIIQ